MLLQKQLTKNFITTRAVRAFAAASLAFSLTACTNKQELFGALLSVGQRIDTPLASYVIKNIGKNGVQIDEYPNGEGSGNEIMVPFDSPTSIGMAKITIDKSGKTISICIGNGC